MGAGASVKRSKASMRNEIMRVRERELNILEEQEKERGLQEAKTEACLTLLRSEKFELAEQLKETRALLRVQSEGWKKEKNKTLNLMFSGLPLSLLSRSSDLADENASLSKRFTMVTVAQCDVVDFSSLTARLQPLEVVTIVDHLHTFIDEAYSNSDIFIMEHTSGGCIAASGLVESLAEERSRTMSPVSMTDSSYGSEFDLEEGKKREQSSRSRTPQMSTGPLSDMKKHPSHYASLLATASLNLMSHSTRIVVPSSKTKQLQLRIALHSGSCSAGVLGLQNSTGASRIPHYKLFGPTIKHTNNLSATGLALQIRVSKECRDLLVTAGGFHFERCPDYLMWARRKPIESYWLVGREGLSLKLPSLDQALSLSEYEDTEI